MYIGSTHRFADRINQHNTLLRKGHTNKALQIAVNKYGIDVFRFTIIETTTYPNQYALEVMKQSWIDYYKTTVKLYNIREDATSNKGVKKSAESKQKQSVIARDWWQHNKDVASKHAKNLWLDKDCRSRMIANHCKYTVIVKDGFGVEYTVTNITAFAKEHGLDPSHFRKLVIGKHKSVKGFVLVNVIERID